MVDSRKLDILKRLTAHLSGISQDTGYEFDLSENVFRGRTAYGADDPEYLVTINESLHGDIDIVTAGLNKIESQERWVLFVQGWMRYEGDNPTDIAYQLMASVQKRLSECVELDPRSGDPKHPTAYHLGSEAVVEMSIGPGIVSTGRRGEDSTSKAFFYLPLGITLALDVSDPFV